MRLKLGWPPALLSIAPYRIYLLECRIINLEAGSDGFLIIVTVFTLVSLPITYNTHGCLSVVSLWRITTPEMRDFHFGHISFSSSVTAADEEG
eukprot:scaffold3497_cov96-Skeletonema_dohrnii-CCMP3373.AAC.1